MPDANGTQAIDRAAQLLVRVVESAQPPSVSELAERAGLPKSTTSRLVSALERQGLVQRLGDRGRLRPGPVLLRFASRDAAATLVELARPSLRRLADASGETINLAVPGAGRHRALRGRHRLGRPPGPVRTRRERQVLPRLERRRRRGDPLARLRHLRRRARGRAYGGRSAGARRRGHRRRRPFDFRTIGTTDLRPHRAARTASRGRGGRACRAARLPRPRTRSCMSEDEILKGLYDNTLVGNAPEVKDLTNRGLEEGLGPEKMLYDALIPSLEEVGARFERGDFFVPEMLIAARAMQG